MDNLRSGSRVGAGSGSAYLAALWWEWATLPWLPCALVGACFYWGDYVLNEWRDA